MTCPPTCLHSSLHVQTYLPTYLPICLSTCLPAYLPTYLPICLSTCLPTYLSACLPAYLPAYIPTCLSTSLHIHTQLQTCTRTNTYSITLTNIQTNKQTHTFLNSGHVRTKHHTSLSLSPYSPDGRQVAVYMWTPYPSIPFCEVLQNKAYNWYGMRETGLSVCLSINLDYIYLSIYLLIISTHGGNSDNVTVSGKYIWSSIIICNI